MKAKKGGNVTAAFARAMGKLPTSRYVLRLYVTGLTSRSTRAVANARSICEEHLQGRYALDVIDVYQGSALAKGDEIVAVPTLIKKLPAPLRRIIGDLSDRERVLMGLGLKAKSAAAP